MKREPGATTAVLRMSHLSRWTCPSINKLLAANWWRVTATCRPNSLVTDSGPCELAMEMVAIGERVGAFRHKESLDRGGHGVHKKRAEPAAQRIASRKESHSEAGAA